MSEESETDEESTGDWGNHTVVTTAPVIIDLTKQDNRVHETRGSKDDVGSLVQVPQTIPEKVLQISNWPRTHLYRATKKSFFVELF